MEGLPANAAGRSSGVAVLFSQRPWKSGRPSGVRGRSFCADSETLTNAAISAIRSTRHCTSPLDEPGWQCHCTVPHLIFRQLRRFHMGLRDKYDHAIQTAKSLRMQGSADERDGKLYFHGTVGTEAEVNKIWDAIKTVPDWRNDIVGDIKATGAPAAAAEPARTYTVKPGDTLSKIAK